jgi:hypothetical protein
VSIIEFCLFNERDVSRDYFSEINDYYMILIFIDINKNNLINIVGNLCVFLVIVQNCIDYNKKN